jgi:hypothetical protein
MGGGLGPARFGSYRKRLGGASVSTVRLACSLLASEAVTAVTSCPPTTHHFLDIRKSVPICGVFSGRWRTHGDDRVSDAHASQHCDICHSGSSELGGHLDSADTHLVTVVSIPGPVVGAGLPRSALRLRWPSRLVATATTIRLNCVSRAIKIG